jgi:transcriptional regulator with XRE-family HTH domain
MLLLRADLPGLIRSARLDLDIGQAELAAAAGISRAYLASIESGRANPTVEVVDRLLSALGLEVVVAGRSPGLPEPRTADLVHARCSAYVHRRLVGAGFACLREVPLLGGRILGGPIRGWIDILAFDPRTGSLYVIEIKTKLLDLGSVERQLGTYEEAAGSIARARGWSVQRIMGWLVCLDSQEIAGALRFNGPALRVAFPLRAHAMRRALAGEPDVPEGRGLALVDPTSRGRDWLLASPADGRRRKVRFRDYTEAAAFLRGDGHAPSVSRRHNPSRLERDRVRESTDSGRF